MIVFLGRDEKGHYADREGQREYMDYGIWQTLTAGAVQDFSQRFPVKITESITLHKFENGELVETITRDT